MADGGRGLVPDGAGQLVVEQQPGPAAAVQGLAARPWDSSVGPACHYNFAITQLAEGAFTNCQRGRAVGTEKGRGAAGRIAESASRCGPVLTTQTKHLSLDYSDILSGIGWHSLTIRSQGENG